MNRKGRLYCVSFENVTVSASQDLFELTPADDKPLMIHWAQLMNVGGTADAGDAQEEMLRLLWRRGFTTSGSGGTAPTPAPLNPNDPASSFTAEVNNTTVATTGTNVDLYPDGWNVRTPWVWLPPPDCQLIVTQAQTTLVLRLMAAPADALSVSGFLIAEEL